MRKKTQDPKRTSPKVVVDGFEDKNSSKRKKRGSDFEERKQEYKDALASKILEKTKHQDPQWYSANEQLTRDVTNLPFVWKNGLTVKVPLAKTVSIDTVDLSNKWAVPSVVAYGVAFTLGIDEELDSLNTIANNLYSWVRYANSGSKNYESEDLFMYFGACVSAYGLVAHVTKLIGLLNYANPVNRSLPRQIFEACGIDYEDALGHIADYRSKLNSLIVRLNAYNVPRRLFVYNAAYWACSGVYIESSNEKDQLYTCYPTYGMKFSGTHKNGSALELRRYQFETIADILDEIRGVIDALDQDEDIGIMSGDLLKVAGKEDCYAINLVPENIVMIPQFDETILYKLKNARIPFSTPNFTSSSVALLATLAGVTAADKLVEPGSSLGIPYIYYQDRDQGSQDNKVKTGLYLNYKSATHGETLIQIEQAYNGFIDSENDHPTSDEINEDVSWRYRLDETTYITPDNASWLDPNTAGYAAKVITCGVILVTNVVIYSANSHDVPILRIIKMSTNIYSVPSESESEFMFTSLITSEIPTFKFLMGTLIPKALNVRPLVPLGNITNVHFLTSCEIDNIIDQQLLSMYGVPASQHFGFKR